ncbi:hypothetical protein SLEP1_g48985 [Rubroshorea leprosula]|uniref:Uncharacterized protein n=1 Tax=Rubroshorea leprosula TaxID=152421 RepID=A0AAV5LVF6_9ROSI|nr:hypothetical protein SLEP1_g48985 [Rubroshorea leprosula]
MVLSGLQGISKRKTSSSLSLELSLSHLGVNRVVIRESLRKDLRPQYPFRLKNWFIIGLLLVMAMGFLALTLFLFLNLDVNHRSPSSTLVTSSPGIKGVWMDGCQAHEED